MMRAQKSGIIGLITGAISTKNQPTNQQGLPDLFIVQGIQRALESSGMTVMIADTGRPQGPGAPSDRHLPVAPWKG
jgi:LacI family transcriptional regulator